jgi:hypothetical protein
MPTVMRMWDYWLLEPPASKLLAMRYGYMVGKSGDSPLMAIPGATRVLKGRTAFRSLPRYVRDSIIKDSGLTEVEYYRRMNEAAKKAIEKPTP